MEHKKHLRADFLRSEIAKLKEWIETARDNIKTGTSAKILFRSIGEINLTIDHSGVIRDLASSLKESLEKELKRREEEYKEI